MLVYRKPAKKRTLLGALGDNKDRLYDKCYHDVAPFYFSPTIAANADALKIKAQELINSPVVKTNFRFNSDAFTYNPYYSPNNSGFMEIDFFFPLPRLLTFRVYCPGLPYTSNDISFYIGAYSPVSKQSTMLVYMYKRGGAAAPTTSSTNNHISGYYETEGGGYKQVVHNSTYSASYTKINAYIGDVVKAMGHNAKEGYLMIYGTAQKSYAAGSGYAAGNFTHNGRLEWFSISY